MKKQNFLTMTILVVLIGLVSCGGSYKAKTPKLATQEDSLNYALGLVISSDLKMTILQNDTSVKSNTALVEKIEKMYNNENNDQAYKTGLRIGNMISDQRKGGLIGDSTLIFNEELFKKWLVKGIAGDTTGITGPHAMVYFQTTVQKIKSAKILNSNQAPVQTDTIKK